eukprot:TRINITY_DN70249_c0_g1_i1.p1 TRINITY_DN70249_c0_g1~~TRINITY_DN70249_c0_g1_i1.p1  ORF type:complete len:371 (+),score=117.91 TRINITY_DN70249_c0_g1_i1:76-1113(+)
MDRQQEGDWQQGTPPPAPAAGGAPSSPPCPGTPEGAAGREPQGCDAPKRPRTGSVHRDPNAELPVVQGEDEVISLWVGDRRFRTFRSTLTKYEGSMLEVMFSGRHPVSRDADGNCFIDGNAELFEEVLYFLQRGKWDPPRDPQKRERFIDEMRYFGLLQFTPLSASGDRPWRLQPPGQGCTVVVSQDGLNATKVADQQGQRNSMVVGDRALTRGVHRWRVECHGLQDGRWIWAGVAPRAADGDDGEPWYVGWGWSTMGYENRGDVHVQNQVWEFRGPSTVLLLEYNADSGTLRVSGAPDGKAYTLRGLPSGLYPGFIFSRLNNSVTISPLPTPVEGQGCGGGGQD